jgi:molybdopterin molybdotransferase
MLPKGADGVVMIEHAAMLDDTTVEVYRSVAPGQHVVEIGEDFREGRAILESGQYLRPQETGLLAAFGHQAVQVFQRPTIAIVSTGDEVVAVERMPAAGQIRDVNSYSLSALVQAAGGLPMRCGIVGDNYEALYGTCSDALASADMVLLSGGSSVGARDYTIDVLTHLPDSRILVHGISISPGKPTILANTQGKAVWGLPGHVVSAMVVFKVVVQPFIARVAGEDPSRRRTFRIPARLSRNIKSAQGRTDFVRVRLSADNGEYRAEPILGKSGLLNTMVLSDGLIEIDANTEGIDAGAAVAVIPF